MHPAPLQGCSIQQQPLGKLDVAGIRETSIVFAAVFGWLILGESFGTTRVALAAIVVGGLVILKLS